MGYDVSLTRFAGDPSIAETFETTVTYNFHKVYRLVGFNVRELSGMTGAASAPLLQALVAFLGTEDYRDPWAPTPGNAGAALARLLKEARRMPDAVWNVVN